MSNKQENQKEIFTVKENPDSENNVAVKYESKTSYEKQDNLSEKVENNLVVDLGDCELNEGASFEFNEDKEILKDTKAFDSVPSDKSTHVIKEDKSPNTNSNNDFEVIDNDKINPSPLTQRTENYDKESSPYMIIDKEVNKIDMKVEVNDSQSDSFNLKDSLANQQNIDAFDQNNRGLLDNQASEKLESHLSKETKNETQLNKETDTNTPKKSSSNNIPILKKLMSSSDQKNFDSKENSEFNTSKLVSNQEKTKENTKNQIINENYSSSPALRAEIAVSSEIEISPKFEKILNTNSEAKHQFRICIVGDSNVGKTALLTRYCDDTFKSSLTNTIGVDFRSLMLKYNDMNIKLQIWDTAGQERFRSISVNYFKSANGFIFVYDISNRKSFENLNNWIEIVEQHNKNTICNFVVGNKCDLEENRQVSLEEGKEFAFSIKFNFMETSAKSAKNVDFAFEIFTFKLIEHYNLHKNNRDSSSNFSVGDGNRFKIDDVYDESIMSKKKKKNGCMC